MNEGIRIQQTLANLADPDNEIHKKAYEAIRASADVRFVDGLITMLRNADTESRLRRDCISLLGYIGESEIVPALLDLLHNTAWHDLKSEIVTALGLIGDNVAVPDLLEMLNQSE